MHGQVLFLGSRVPSLTHILFTDGEYVFVDPDNKVSKYAPKAWKSSNECVSIKQELKNVV